MSKQELEEQVVISQVMVGVREQLGANSVSMERQGDNIFAYVEMPNGWRSSRFSFKHIVLVNQGVERFTAMVVEIVRMIMAKEGEVLDMKVQDETARECK